MRIIRRVLSVTMVFVLVYSCHDLSETNLNPNEISADNVKAPYLITDVQSKFANAYQKNQMGENGYFSPLMQHTQLDAHSSTYNDFEWKSQSWSNYYFMLMNNKLAFEKAEQDGDRFTMAISLTLKSYIYGYLTDLFGDIPYSKSLRVNEPGDEVENSNPEYDKQEDVYMGIIEDLKKASELFSEKPNVGSLISYQDVYYGGDLDKWHKFANSLLLRYYMRLSEKKEDLAKDGIREIAQTGIYFKSHSESAVMKYHGTSSEDSWPDNIRFGTETAEEVYRRVKMCSVLVDTLKYFNDPRLGVWAEKIEVPIKIDDNKFPDNPDFTEDGIRYVHSSLIDPSDPKTFIDESEDYVGIPPSIGSNPSWYNQNPDAGNTGINKHVSHISRMYREASGDYLDVRLQTAAEVAFIFAEAGVKWGESYDGKNAEEWYIKGIEMSMDSWGKSGSDFENYIEQPEVAFDGSIDQVILQKWIASWSAESEAWFDWRRTGYPYLEAGPHAVKERIPLRFIYSGSDPNSGESAKDRLEETNYSSPEGRNSPWSKMWLLQGTGKPW